MVTGSIRGVTASNISAADAINAAAARAASVGLAATDPHHGDAYRIVALAGQLNTKPHLPWRQAVGRGADTCTTRGSMTQTPFAEWQSTHPRVAESLPHRLPDDGSCGTAHFTTAGAALAPAAPGISISKLNALAPHGGHAVGAVSSRDLQKRQPRPKQWEALPTPSGQDDLSSTPA